MPGMAIRNWLVRLMPSDAMGRILFQPPAAWGRGVLVAVRNDGAPAYVAFRQPMGASQVVEVLQCGTAEVLRSTTLPTGG